MIGFVSIVGAGPWDPHLLTLAGKDRLCKADVVIADYLVNPALLLHCSPRAQIIQRERSPHQKPNLSQEQINQCMVEKALAGAQVVRLHGGDPMVFGRGGEEAQILRQHNIPYEIIPGVSAALAAPAAAGIPLTHRQHTPAVSFVSGYEAYEKTGQQVAWTHLAQSAGTLVLMMSVQNCRENCERLIAAGRDPHTPAALIRWGTRGIQQTITAPLSQIAERAAQQHLRPPAVLVVGSVVDLREQLQWLEFRPLFGYRIVVVDIHQQPKSLGDFFLQQGADVVTIPLLEILPPQDPTPLQQAITHLQNIDGILLSSTHGVRAMMNALAQCHLDVRVLAGKIIAAIGEKTIQVCQENGLRPDISIQKTSSTRILETLQSHHCLPKRWFSIRSNAASTKLTKVIHEAGGMVKTVVGYRMERSKASRFLLHSLLPSQAGGEGMDAVYLANIKIAQCFFATLHEVFGEIKTKAMLAQTKLLTTSSKTQKAGEKLGFSLIKINDLTTIQDLLIHQ